MKLPFVPLRLRCRRMLLEEASPRGLSMHGLVLGTALGAIYREAQTIRLEATLLVALGGIRCVSCHALFERTMMPCRRIKDL